MKKNTTRNLIDQLDELYNRTYENCEFYQKEKKQISLANEIGVLRGIYYCMQTIGLEMEDETDFIKMIKIQQDLKGEEVKIWLKPE